MTITASPLTVPGPVTPWIFEKFGWVRDVRWPDPARLATTRVAPSTP